MADQILKTDEAARIIREVFREPACSRCGGPLGTSGPLCDACLTEPGYSITFHHPLPDVQSAALAERKRCAKIADGWPEGYRVGQDIAAKILEGK